MHTPSIKEQIEFLSEEIDWLQDTGQEETPYYDMIKAIRESLKNFQDTIDSIK